jgi:hypothetical protein
MTQNTFVARVEQALEQRVANGQPVTFTATAAATGISRATLYRNPELRTLIQEYRLRGVQGPTLSGLSIEIAQLRASLEAVADRARHHEERIRRLERANTTTKTKK